MRMANNEIYLHKLSWRVCDGTVSDTHTGLMWKCDNEKGRWSGGITETFPFNSVKTLLVDYAGYSGWRLPTIDELKLIDSRAFRFIPTGYFWTSTLGQPSDGWYSGWPKIINIESRLLGFGNPETGEERVLLVRDRKCFNLDIYEFGNGGGKIIRIPDEKKYIEGYNVALTAVANEDSIFIGWKVDVIESSPICNIRMDSAKIVTAEFALRKFFLLQIKTIGTGQGTIRANLIYEDKSHC